MARCRVGGLTSFRSPVIAAVPTLPKFAACFTLSTHLPLQQKAELMMSKDLGLAAPGRLTAWAGAKGREIKEREVPALGDLESESVPQQSLWWGLCPWVAAPASCPDSSTGMPRRWTVSSPSPTKPLLITLPKAELLLSDFSLPPISSSFCFPFFTLTFGCAGLCCYRLSLVAASRGCCLTVVCGLLITVTALVAEHGLQVCGLSSHSE